MKVSELKIYLNHPHGPCDDDEVVVRLSEPSVGPIAMDDVVTVYTGFDWEKGKVVLATNSNLVRRSEKQHLWQLASDFVCMAAMDRRRTKKGEAITALAKQAMAILDVAGYRLDERGRIVGRKTDKELSL